MKHARSPADSMSMSNYSVTILHLLHTLNIVSPGQIMRTRMSREMTARQGDLALCSSAITDANLHTLSTSFPVSRHLRANDDGGSFAYFWGFAYRVSRKSEKCGCTP